jgi:DNA-binding protein HU-beta
MTKAELVSELALTTGYDKKTVSAIFEAFMANVKNNLKNGENVYLRGFGTFTTKTRKAKVARNITQQTSVFVPEHKIPYFKPAKEFQAELR